MKISPCSICNHPDSKKIDERIYLGNSISSIARDFNVTRQSLMRHRDNHLNRDKVEYQIDVKLNPVREANLEARQELKRKKEELEENVRRATDPLKAPDITAPVLTAREIRSTQIDVYADILVARDRAMDLLDQVTSSSSSVYNQAIAIREVRSTVLAMAQLYETQKRIEAEYHGRVDEVFAYKWLKANAPETLARMIEDARKKV